MLEQLPGWLNKALNEFLAIELADIRARNVIFTVLGLSVLVATIGLVQKKHFRRTFLAGIAALILTAICFVILELTWKPFPDRVPLYIYGGGALAFYVLFSAFVQRGRRIFVGFFSILALISAWGVFNLEFQEYPTVRSLNPDPVARDMSFDDFQRAVADRHPPMIDNEPVGAIVTVPFDATQFTHRDAVAYVPPAYFTDPDLRLPVVVLMAGNPGAPQQWFDAGAADSTLDDFQRAHDGKSPIVISVDGTGGFTANPICVDGPKDKVQTFLAKDLPPQIKEKFRVVEDQQKWSIGGLSYGGTCSLQVVTNHPDAYGTFLNYSGQKEPTVGDHGKTVAEFFGGDEAAFQAVNPLTLLNQAKGTNKYAHLHGVFVVGENDVHFRPEMEEMQRATSAAGIKAELKVIAGGHSYQVWRVAFRETIDFAAARGGIE